jgi:hypothetical protein
VPITIVARTSPEDRARGRARLRDESYSWDGPREARDFYARTIADNALYDVPTDPAQVYAHAVADRLLGWDLAKITGRCVMTSTSVRPLRYRHFERLPVDRIGVRCWAIENLLILAHDGDDPQLLLTAARLANPAVDAAMLGAHLNHLLDLAEQVEIASQRVAQASSDWELPRSLVVDEYLEQLERIAKFIGGES